MRLIYARGTKYRLSTWSATLAFAMAVWSPVVMAFDCPGAKKAQQALQQTQGLEQQAQMADQTADAAVRASEEAAKKASEAQANADAAIRAAGDTVNNESGNIIGDKMGGTTGVTGAGNMSKGTNYAESQKYIAQGMKEKASQAAAAAEQAKAAASAAHARVKAAAAQTGQEGEKAPEQDKSSCQSQCSSKPPDQRQQCEQQCEQQCLQQSKPVKPASDKMGKLADLLKQAADAMKKKEGQKKDDQKKDAAKNAQDAKEAAGLGQAEQTLADHSDTKGLDPNDTSTPDAFKLTDPLGNDKGLITNNLDGSKDNTAANLLAGSDLGAGDPNKTNEAGMAGFKGGAKNAVAGAPTGSGGGLDGGSGAGSGTGAATDNGNLISSGFEGGGLGGGGLGGLPGGTGDPVADAIAAISSSNFDLSGEEGGTPGEPEMTLWQKGIQAYQYMDFKTLNPLPEGRGRVMALRQHYISIADKKIAADGIKIEKGASGETPIQQASAVEGRALASPGKEKK